MSATIAVQMAGADFLKLRKKRGTLIWALVLAVAPLVIFFVVRAVQHSSSPAEHPAAGGVGGSPWKVDQGHHPAATYPSAAEDEGASGIVAQR